MILRAFQARPNSPPRLMSAGGEFGVKMGNLNYFSDWAVGGNGRV